jgi:hypothetical protein
VLQAVNGPLASRTVQVFLQPGTDKPTTLNLAPASWTAVAKRSGDTAFARAGRERTFDDFRPRQSGGALRFPPQSKTSRNEQPVFWSQAAVLLKRSKTSSFPPRVSSDNG